MDDKKIKLMIEAILNDKRFRAGVKGMTDATGQAEKKQTSFLKNMKAGWLAIAGVVYGAIRAFKSVLSIISDFEQSVANVASVSGGAKEEIAALAREAGKSRLGFSAKQSADALYYLASAGLDVTEMSQVLQPALRLAAAAQMDIAEATNTVVNQLKVYGGDMTKAGQFTDIMAKTVASANTNMQQLGDALNYSSSVASLAGVSFADLNAMIAAMADLGIKGGKAGVQLRMAFTRLLKPTAQAADILKNKYNIEIKDLQKMLREGKVIDALKLLRDANIDIGDSLELFGVRQSTFIKLVKDGIPTIEKLQDRIAKAGGAAQKMADVQLDTLQGKAKIMKSAMHELVLSLSGSSGMEPALKAVQEGIIDAITATTKWLLETQALQKTMAAFSAIFKTLYLSGMLIFNGSKALFRLMRLEAKNIVDIFSGIGKLIKAAWERDWEGIKDIAKDTFDKIKGNGKEFVDGYIDDYEEVKKTTETIWNDILIIANGVQEKIQQKSKETNEILQMDMDAHVQAWRAAQKEKIEATNEYTKKDLENQAIVQEETLKNFSVLKQIAIDLADARIENLRRAHAEEMKNWEESNQAAIDYNEFMAGKDKQRYDAMSQEEKDEYDLRQAYLEAKEKIEKQHAREMAIAERKKAVLEKTAALFSIAADTAAGIMKAVKAFWFSGGMPWSAIIAGLGVAQAGAVLAQPLPEVPAFAKGVNELLDDTFAQLHKGERVVPANMNIPGLSNEALMMSALRGLAVPMASNTSLSYDQRKYSTEQNVSNTFNVPRGAVGIDEVLAYARRTNSRVLER